MKHRVNHFKREAWTMVLLLPAIIVIGMSAGFVISSLGRMFGWHPH